MDNDIRKLASLFQEAEPPVGLAARIVARVRSEAEKANAARRTVFYSLTAILSFAAMVLAGHEAFSSVSQTGFAEYVGLLFYDVADVLNAGWSFAYAALESLPVLPIAATLISFALLFESVRRLAHNLNNHLMFKQVA